MDDPFDAALADLQRFIAVDIDGDGRPDVIMSTADVRDRMGPDMMPERAMRRVTQTGGVYNALNPYNY